MTDLRIQYLLNFARSPQSLSGFGAGVFAVFEHLNSINENMPDPNGQLMRIVIGGPVIDRLWIKYHHIGKHPGFQKTAMIQTEVSCRQS